MERARRLRSIESYKRVYVELAGFVFSKASKSPNAPTAYRAPTRTDQKTVLENQDRPLLLPQCYLKMEIVGEVEVVDVRDNAEPEVACRRVEECLVDENGDIF